MISDLLGSDAVISTCIDLFFTGLTTLITSQAFINKLYGIIIDQEYDSESLIQDVQEPENSNIHKSNKMLHYTVFPENPTWSVRKYPHPRRTFHTL